MSGVLMDEPGEAFPTLLPLGGLLLTAAVWLCARVTRARDASRYDRERLAAEARRLSQVALTRGQR